MHLSTHLHLPSTIDNFLNFPYDRLGWEPDEPQPHEWWLRILGELRNAVSSYGEGELTQLVLRGHGNQHSLRLGPQSVVGEGRRPWQASRAGSDFFIFNDAAFGLRDKLAKDASIVLDGCYTGGPEALLLDECSTGVARVISSIFCDAQGGIEL